MRRVGAFTNSVCTLVTRNAPNDTKKGRCGVSISSTAAYARLCAPLLPSSCLAVFVKIAGDNRVRYSPTIDLVVIMNNADRFEQVFAHARAYTTARPHGRARPHDRAIVRPHKQPHNRTTARPHDRGVWVVCPGAPPQYQQKRKTEIGNVNAFPFLPAIPVVLLVRAA